MHKVRDHIQVYNFRMAQKRTKHLRHAVGGQFVGRLDYSEPTVLAVIDASITELEYLLGARHLYSKLSEQQKTLLEIYLSQELVNL